MILALDTTSEFGSMALVDNGDVADEVLLHSPDGFGHVLFAHIAAMLRRRGARIKDMECFAAASGPGSFTGVRIGLTAAKGLAEATGRPVVAVSNLQALACYSAAELRATVLDARRGEVYGAVYDRDLRLHQPEVVMKFQDWIKALPVGDIELISTNAALFAPLLRDLSRGIARRIPEIAAPRALAGAIGHIAFRRLLAGDVCDPAAIDANYVRRSDAELFWKT